MTTCDYCGGEHDRAHCPNCGAPARQRDRAHEESRQFKLQMAAAMGFTAHYFVMAASTERDATMAAAAGLERDQEELRAAQARRIRGSG